MKTAQEEARIEKALKTARNVRRVAVAYKWVAVDGVTCLEVIHLWSDRRQSRSVTKEKVTVIHEEFTDETFLTENEWKDAMMSHGYDVRGCSVGQN